MLNTLATLTLISTLFESSRLSEKHLLLRTIHNENEGEAAAASILKTSKLHQKYFKIFKTIKSRELKCTCSTQIHRNYCTGENRKVLFSGSK